MVQNIIKTYQTKQVQNSNVNGNVFYYNTKTIRAKCSKCKYKCVVKHDQWSYGRAGGSIPYPYPQITRPVCNYPQIPLFRKPAELTVTRPFPWKCLAE